MRTMFLFDNKSKLDVRYGYTKRHTDTVYCPDDKKERYDLPEYDKSNGGLFYGQEVAWKGEVLLNGSVDINVNVNSIKYIDRIYLTQGENSKIGSVEIFTEADGVLKKIGCSDNKNTDEAEINISVGYYCDKLIIRLNGCYERIAVKKLDVLVSEGLENAIYPVPDSLEERIGFLPYSAVKTIEAEGGCAQSAADYLIGKLSAMGVNAVTGTGGEIVLIHTDRDDEGYEIETDTERCTIKAGCRRGFIYAVDTFMQLAAKEGFRACKITDKPFMDIRGVHFALPSRADIPFLKKLIRDVWVPMKYNTVFLQLSGVMRYDKFPQINEKWKEACTKYEKGEWPMPPHYHFLGHDILEKDEVRDLCEYIRSFGLEIVPEVQSLSHIQYITMAFPELAEVEHDNEQIDDVYTADEKPQSFYAHNMCPSHKDYYNIIFELIDEAVEVVQPERYVHMGHDEYYVHGACPECSKKGSAKVFSEEVTKLNDYVKSKGLTMMIWSDMLQNEYYSIPEAINNIPKDVIMLDFTWYFHPEEDLENKLLDAGFRVLMGNMYSSHYPRFDTRKIKQGMTGAEVSTWVDLNEHSYAYEGKMYDFVYSANMMWNKDFDSAYRNTYGEIVKNSVWEIRRKIGEFNTENTEEIVFDKDIRNIPNELIWSIPYDGAAAASAESDVEVIVNGKADSLFFTQATDMPCDRVMWNEAQKIGEYEIIYDDNSAVYAPVYYGVDIANYGRKYAMPIESFLFRHEGYIGTYMSRPICGKDSNGKDYTLYDYPVKNPHPDKTIKKVILHHSRNTDAVILLFDVKVSK